MAENKKHLHAGHRKRLKAQFLAHGEDFHDHQLLEVLLFYAIPQGDVNGLSHQLLEQFGSLAGVLDAMPESLQQVPGVGEHTTVLLKLIPKLAGRYLEIRNSKGTILDSPKAVRGFLLPYFRQGFRNEVVYLVCMDSKHKVLSCQRLAEGSVNAAAITPRRVVEVALACNATSVVLAHNHISGLAIPSQDDLATTQMLWDLLQNVGVELMDHLVFSNDDMVSMRESGIFQGFYREGR